MPTALITGAAGQDGPYLARLLLQKEYRVICLVRPGGSSLDQLSDQVEVVAFDMADMASLPQLLERFQPDEIYHLAAFSHVGGSWNAPAEYTWMNAVVSASLLESVRQVVPQAHFYQACSSEIFGLPDHFPQNEETPFHPRNPYATAKAAAYWSVANYRDAYGMFAVNGILYNHESPRRPETYVTRKISKAVARIKLGIQHELFLGNLDARRDWGYAEDYVLAMWQMLQHDTPEDFVIGTGQSRSVRQFCEVAFACVGLNYEDYVRVDIVFYRPLEPGLLVADAQKARKLLGWQPKVSFDELVQRMVAADLEAEMAVNNNHTAR